VRGHDRPVVKRGGDGSWPRFPLSASRMFTIAKSFSMMVFTSSKRLALNVNCVGILIALQRLSARHDAAIGVGVEILRVQQFIQCGNIASDARFGLQSEDAHDLCLRIAASLADLG